jgi:hypothetical protein
MAISFSYTVKTINDPSNLPEGWRPAILLDVTEEDTPQNWQMHEKSPRMKRWHFAVWSDVSQIGHVAPEHQTAPSSTIFSPGGRNPASKAFVWTKELLGCEIFPGQDVSLHPPIACRVKIKRKEIYANVMDLERWPEGEQLLTPDFRANLLLWWQQKQAMPAPATPPQTREPQPNVTAWPGTVQGGPLHATPPVQQPQQPQPSVEKKGW